MFVNDAVQRRPSTAHVSHPSVQVLVFVNDAEAGMRARLFLEAFGVRAALLNAELPLNSRHHILQASCHWHGLLPGVVCWALPGC